MNNNSPPHIVDLIIDLSSTLTATEIRQNLSRQTMCADLLLEFEEVGFKSQRRKQIIKHIEDFQSVCEHPHTWVRPFNQWSGDTTICTICGKEL